MISPRIFTSMFEGIYLRQCEVCWYSNQTDNVGKWISSAVVIKYIDENCCTLTSLGM